MKIDRTIKYEDFSLPNHPHTTKTLDCYIDDISHHEDNGPTWQLVTGSIAQSHFSHGTDPNTGNNIAKYTYNADDITSQTIIECKCQCLRQCPIVCHYPVTVTLEGMFYYKYCFFMTG